MADNKDLLSLIGNVFQENDTGDITAVDTKDVLDAIVETLGTGYQYMGIATTSTSPPSNFDGNIFYITTTPGTYAAFSNIVVPEGIIGIIRNTNFGFVLDSLPVVVSADNIIYNTNNHSTTNNVGNIPAGTDLDGRSLSNILDMMFFSSSSKSLTRIAITTAPTKTTYNVGENFSSAGMVVTAYFNDGTQSVITGYTVVGGTNLQETTTSVVISYTYGADTETVQQAITVESVSAKLTDVKIWMNHGFLTSGMTAGSSSSEGADYGVTGIFSDGYERNLIYDTEYSISPNIIPDYGTNPTTFAIEATVDGVSVNKDIEEEVQYHELTVTISATIGAGSAPDGDFYEGEEFTVINAYASLSDGSGGPLDRGDYTLTPQYAPTLNPGETRNVDVVMRYEYSDTVFDEFTLEYTVVSSQPAVQYPTLTNPSLVVNTMQADKGSPLATYNNNIQSGVEIEIDITLNKGTINPDYSLTPPAVSDRIGEVDLASAILDPRYMGSGLDFVGVIVGENYATAILEQGGSETRWNVPLDCTLIVPYAAGKQPVDSAGNDYETPHPDGTFEVHNQGIDFAIAGVFANSSNIATPSLLDILYEDLTFDADEFLVGMQLELEFTSFETVDHKYELHLNSQLEITNVEIWDSFDEIWLPLSSYTFAVVGGEEGVAPNTRIWRSTAPRNTNGALYRFTITEI